MYRTEVVQYNGIDKPYLNGAHCSMAMRIPGYYYDADKNRYFKITNEKPGPVLPRPQKPLTLSPTVGAPGVCKVSAQNGTARPLSSLVVVVHNSSFLGQSTIS